MSQQLYFRFLDEKNHGISVPPTMVQTCNLTSRGELVSSGFAILLEDLPPQTKVIHIEVVGEEPSGRPFIIKAKRGNDETV